MARPGMTLEVPCLFALSCAINGPPQVVGRLDSLLLMGSNVGRLAIAYAICFAWRLRWPSVHANWGLNQGYQYSWLLLYSLVMGWALLMMFA